MEEPPRGAGVRRGRPDGRRGRQEFLLAHPAISIDPGHASASPAQTLPISGYTQGTINGAYFGVASSPTHYPAARDPGYSKAFAMDVIRNIRTDLDAFSEVEQAVLMNHGYALIDAAIRTHAPELIATDAAAFALPAMNEDELRRRLAGSQKRKLTGRG